MENITLAPHETSAITVQASDSPSLSSDFRDSAAVRRLMEEVRLEDMVMSSAAAAYNRQHNRHNR